MGRRRHRATPKEPQTQAYASSSSDATTPPPKKKTKHTASTPRTKSTQSSGTAQDSNDLSPAQNTRRRSSRLANPAHSSSMSLRSATPQKPPLDRLKFLKMMMKRGTSTRKGTSRMTAVDSTSESEQDSAVNENAAEESVDSGDKSDDEDNGNDEVEGENELDEEGEDEEEMDGGEEEEDDDEEDDDEEDDDEEDDDEEEDVEEEEEDAEEEEEYEEEYEEYEEDKAKPLTKNTKSRAKKKAPKHTTEPSSKKAKDGKDTPSAIDNIDESSGNSNDEETRPAKADEEPSDDTNRYDETNNAEMEAEEEQEQENEEEEEEELSEGLSESDNDGESTTTSLANLTRRQRAKLSHSHEELLELPTESKRSKYSAEEMALRKSEHARRRKFQSMQRAEQLKNDTINRLLNKQTSKGRNKVSDDIETRSASDDVAGADSTPDRIRYRQRVLKRRGSDGTPVHLECTVSLPKGTGIASLFPGGTKQGKSSGGSRYPEPLPKCSVAGCNETKKYCVKLLYACSLEHWKQLNSSA